MVVKVHTVRYFSRMAEERDITATKLRRDLGAVLDAVMGGTTVRVSRNGRPLAVLVPPQRFDGMTDAQPYGDEFKEVEP